MVEMLCFLANKVILKILFGSLIHLDHQCHEVYQTTLLLGRLSPLNG